MLIEIPSKESRSGKRELSFVCPECRKETGVADYTSAASGTLILIVVCPHPGCRFHDLIELKKYSKVNTL
jgi:hypothetical protein